MVRVILGSAVGAVLMLVVGFLLFATPLNSLGTGSIGNVEAAQVQGALATHLRSTGTYQVPDPDTAEQTVMYGQGPIATIHFNAHGYAAGDAGMLLSGLVLNFIVALIIGFGLIGIDRRVPDFGSRAKLVLAFAAASAILIHLGRAIYMHHDWSNAIFMMIGDGLVIAAGGLAVAWFLPKHRSDPARTNASSEG